MMTIVLALLAVQAPPADPGAQAQFADQDIVVEANRLDMWRGEASFARKTPRCKTIRSTGDRLIDRIGCDAMTQCIVQTRGKFEISRKNWKNVAPEDMAEWHRLMGRCVKDRREQLLRAHVAVRRGR